MKPYKLAIPVTLEKIPAQADQRPAASQLADANVDLTSVPKSVLAWTLLCAQFSAVVTANLASWVAI
jgi:hypothetical protein